MKDGAAALVEAIALVERALQIIDASDAGLQGAPHLDFGCALLRAELALLHFPNHTPGNDV